MNCTCKKSEYVDEDWRNFLVFDKYCPKHGYENNGIIKIDISMKRPTQQHKLIDQENINLLQQMGQI